jgi:site-specific DNA-cytosine methylase
LLKYVRSLPFENPPRIVILENVANMAKKRQVEQGCQVATQIVADLFDKAGYTADWDVFNAKDYFHPQSRERLWIVMWHRPSLECSLETHERYAKVLHEVLAIMMRFKTERHETLEVVLDRMKSSAERVSKARESKEITETAKKENLAFAVKNSLVINPKDEASFMALARPLMSMRAAKVCYLKMAHEKKIHGWRWEEDLLVASVSQFVNWISAAHDCFPTLTPTSPFLVLHRGQPFQASGRLALVVQGVQNDAAIFMKIADLPDALQQDFAGNAFSSNICIALLVSTVVVNNALSS